MKTKNNTALTAVSMIDPERFADKFGALMDRIGPRFCRREPRERAGSLIMGLLGLVERKNSWTIAEHRGDCTPDGFQHVLSRAKWDADEVLDDVRVYVVDAFGDLAAVLIVDETGDVTKGVRSVGVQRQYTGTAGRIENAQVAVYLTYSGARGHALIDRALYLSASWTEDSVRCDEAGIPVEEQVFATKPALALRMIASAIDAGAPTSWVTGDEVYGNDPPLRGALEDRRVGYVLAVVCSHRVRVGAARVRADVMAQSVPDSGWHTRSAGAGPKGNRWYSWASITLERNDTDDGECSVLVRRNDQTGELAYYRCFAPTPVPLAALVSVVGRRWKIEESFQTAKGQAGLDEHQVRRWCSWHRWATLVMAAMAFPAVATAGERDRTPPPTGLIALTLNEFRHQLNALVIAQERTVEQGWAWSIWRRKRQEAARICHYQRRSGNSRPELLLYY